MSQDKTSNRAKAPIAAANFDKFREVFGEGIKMIYVKEGGIELGDRVDEIAATCFYGADGNLLSDLQKKAA